MHISCKTVFHRTAERKIVHVIYGSVGAAAWHAGRQSGIFISVVSALAWLLVDHTSGHQYTYWAILFWNGMVRLGFFILVTFLLSELEIVLRREEMLSSHDGLTGILNARAFKAGAGNLLDLASRHNHPSILGYIDLDGFKSINDTLGHTEGDRVLKCVADVIQEQVRKVDLVARLGGDESAVFLPETDRSGAEILFPKLRQKVMQKARSGNWPISLSIGVIVLERTPKNIDEAIKSADNLMYQVKKSGKITSSLMNSPK
jgi:diguanylate cyclase (GGDEF)-like protein